MRLYSKKTPKEVDKKELKDLIGKLNADTISLAELEALHQFLQQQQSESELSAFYDDQQSEDLAVQTPKLDRLDRLLADHRILKQQQHIRSSRSMKITVRWAAVSAAACISVFFLWQLFIAPRDQQLVKVANQILPGGNKAKIMLANGSVLDLESLKNDTTVQLDGYAIVKAKDGSVRYMDTDQLTDQEIYNTIITPSGGQYRLELTDGTKVLVNASSSLKYPIYFKGPKRKVALNGEAFFEVAKNNIDGTFIPFVVTTGPQEIEVLGTSFNVNSHDSTIETTLVEGSVRLHYKDLANTSILRPNQQAIYLPERKSLTIKKVDPFYAIAWKDGAFAFENEPIKEVMDEISRWYNVTVSYREDMSDVFFSGRISKYEDFSKLLNTIELTGSVRFKIEGRRILVMR